MIKATAIPQTPSHSMKIRNVSEQSNAGRKWDNHLAWGSWTYHLQAGITSFLAPHSTFQDAQQVSETSSLFWWPLMGQIHPQVKAFRADLQTPAAEVSCPPASSRWTATSCHVLWDERKVKSFPRTSLTQPKLKVFQSPEIDLLFDFIPQLWKRRQYIYLRCCKNSFPTWESPQGGISNCSVQGLGRV